MDFEYDIYKNGDKYQFNIFCISKITHNNDISES